MPNLYVRASALPNICGRVDYISSPKRQERLLASYDGAAELLGGKFWKTLAQESREAFEQFGYEKRNGKKEKMKCCEGREIMIVLSNSLLQRFEPHEIVKIVADKFKEKYGLTVAAGLHLKHEGNGKDNLHVHVVFPERQLLTKPVEKVAERNLFFDANGKRCYKKSEIVDENKQLLPGCRIVKKGEVYERRCFGPVDTKYSSKSWLKELKTDFVLPLRNGILCGDVEIKEYDKSTGKLPQQHIPKGMSSSNAIKIVKANEMVVKFNSFVDKGVISRSEALKYQAKVLSMPDRNEALREVLWSIEREQSRAPKGKRLVAHRDWKTQSMIDAIRIARETEAGSAEDLEKALRERGKELNQAKKEYEALKESDDIQKRMDAAIKVKDATERYKEVSRAMESIRRQETPER